MGKMVKIDGNALSRHLKDSGKTPAQISLDMGSGKGYVSHAIIDGRMGRAQYRFMCSLLGVPLEQFIVPEKHRHTEEMKAQEPDKLPEQQQEESLEMLRRIEKDIVRLGQIMLDIRELLKGGNLE